jgi:hypothetical protein
VLKKRYSALAGSSKTARALSRFDLEDVEHMVGIVAIAPQIAKAQPGRLPPRLVRHSTPAQHDVHR